MNVDLQSLDDETVHFFRLLHDKLNQVEGNVDSFGRACSKDWCKLKKSLLIQLRIPYEVHIIHGVPSLQKQ